MRREAATFMAIGLLAAAGGATAALAASGTGGTGGDDDTTTAGTGTTTTGTTPTTDTTTTTTTSGTTPTDTTTTEKTTTAAVTVPAHVTTTPRTVADVKGDVRNGLDIRRFTFARASDGRLRATITLASAWDGRDLLSATGVPGSICVKAWTTAAPPDTTPDYLICTTAMADAALRGSVLQQRANKLPARVAGADVSRPSQRTVTLRFSQSAIGRPAVLYVAAEGTRPACTRGSCIDLAPEAPTTLVLRLRKPATGK
jgi:hypothetical protein